VTTSINDGATQTRTDRQVDVRTPAGETSGSVTLPGELFDANANVSLMHQVVVAQLAAARQGTHSTKTRGKVSGGGAKPYRQKGTGRARQGSTRAPQFAGGGVVHGPHPRSYDQRTPKKMKAAALRGALSDRARDGRIHVVDGFGLGDAPSTKTALASLVAISDRHRFLVVLERTDAVTWLSLRNAPQVHIVAVDQLNTYDVLAADDVVFTKGAYDVFVGGPAAATERRATVTQPPGDDAVTEDKPAKKTAAKKTTAKKTAAKKSTKKSADEATDEKPAAKKTAAKKTAAKKATTKKAAADDSAEKSADAETAEEGSE
jgi:large subunit ribosomal protein L4